MRKFLDHICIDTRDRGRAFWRILFYSFGSLIDTDRMRFDKFFIVQIVAHDDMHHRECKRSIRTWANLDMLIGMSCGAIRTATLTKKHKSGDFVGAVAEFAKWVKNDSKVLKGLVRRRKAEADLYSKP